MGGRPGLVLLGRPRLFGLLGRQEDNPLLPRLRRQPNVALAGPCPLNEVPDWLFRCDVLLELLREDRPDSDVISGRLYEYLSTGKPIVSMLWPEQVEIFPDVVYGAHDEREFLTLCQHALEEAPGFVSQRRQSYGAAAAAGVTVGKAIGAGRQGELR